MRLSIANFTAKRNAIGRCRSGIVKRYRSELGKSDKWNNRYESGTVKSLTKMIKCYQDLLQFQSIYFGEQFATRSANLSHTLPTLSVLFARCLFE